MKIKLCLIFFIIVTFSCNQSEHRSVKNEYPAYISKSFIDGCLEDNSNPDITQTLICSCLIEKIQRKYTVEEFIELGKLQSGAKWNEYQKFLNKAAEECKLPQIRTVS